MSDLLESIEFDRARKKIKAISLVPLINVVFMLVLFFLIAGHMEKFAIVPVELPSADSGQLLDEGPIVIVLGRYDEILINDELYTLEQVLPTLQLELKNNKARIITIKADAQLEANKLIGVIEQVRRAGGTNFSLVTQAGAS